MLRRLLILGGLLLVASSFYLGWWIANQPGRFVLKTVQMEGVIRTPLQMATEQMRIDKDANLLWVDPRTIKERLEAMPWIRSAWVRRIFPDTLAVQITEKIPVCMGVIEEKLHIMDEYGQPIKPFATGDTMILPIVRPAANKESAREVVWMINLLDRFPGLKGMISEAVGFSGKRWALYTTRGIKLLISENAEQELGLLMRLQEKYKILDRKIQQVELRIPGKVAVRRLP
ncbi:MAG: FtsQ-type POTRA domain-containing protein [Magnetococcales bacterium]|nr:FtsQ-type POTRA domain-containing protein [Magnetococcales bacterium]MBF0150865.1 FtsQ-type POTRA domain-containing protein [Magnetococcales bacterium]MBF0173860.1 FtsQ-type POTRA domain-containing protein [Magnetococcales bacterium]MBF0347002.1 FtsQ-type POTRA domain-containing protein [Magnetococcales bacterium]MBF0631322.1 FtsQ-type POTRA domain-containing protein [Magnetococcales bacterium]